MYCFFLQVYNQCTLFIPFSRELCNVLSMWIHALVNTSFHPSFLINFSQPKKITIETKKEGGGKQNLWLLCHFLIYLLHLYQKTTKCTAFQQLFVRTKKWIDFIHVASKTFSGKIPGGNGTKTLRGTPYDGLYREALTERGIFSRLLWGIWIKG